MATDLTRDQAGSLGVVVMSKGLNHRIQFESGVAFPADVAVGQICNLDLDLVGRITNALTDQVGIYVVVHRLLAAATPPDDRTGSHDH